MGYNLLLLMFAAVILGGLGTAFGAMVGGLVVGFATEVSTIWAQPSLKFVFALAALVLALLVRPQGILGRSGDGSGEERSRSGLDIIFGNGLRAAIGPEAAMYALLAIGLNLHWGYTGLLNLGQVGFMLVGAYGLAIIVATVGWSMWIGVPIGLARRRRARARPRASRRCVCVPTTSRSPPSRSQRSSDRGPLPPALEGVTGGPFGLQQIADPFYDINPIPSGTYGFGVVTFSENRLWVMLVTWVLVLLCTGLVVVLVRQPLGPGHARRSARTRTPPAAWARTSSRSRCSPSIIGGIIGGARRRDVRHPSDGRQRRELPVDSDVLRLHDPDPGRRGHPPGPDRWEPSSSGS